MTEKKPRVYQIAKDFNVSSEALIGILQGLGVKAKSHMSTLDPSAVELVRQKFSEEKQAVQANDARKQEAKAARERETVQPVEPPRAPKPVADTPAPPVMTGPVEASAAPPVASPKPSPPLGSAPVRPAPPARPKAGTPGTAPPATPPAAAGSTGGTMRPQARPERRRRRVADERTVRDSVKRTLAGLDGGAKSKRYKKRITEETSVATQEVAENKNQISVNEFASVAELAERLDVTPSQVITKLLGMGRMATQNQRLDKETIELVAMEFDFGVDFEAEYGTERIEEPDTDKPEDLKPRPPVVTVMGHVDHGKTSLLDHVRKANVVAGEKGGITQHIGAYEVKLENGREVTFLDTPGHQAFTAMRARGAQATDIVVLVVAADDRVMPQTIEAIDHARAAGVPMIVAINKVDKPEANIPMVKQDLAGHNVMIEEYGGQVSAVEISAKTGQGIDELLELILLQADLLEITANPDRRARGVVIESKLEQGRGVVATVLVQNGSLKVGEPFVCGNQFGKVRAMSDERSNRVKLAGPSTPVEVTGWSGSPLAGDQFMVTPTESDAREIGMERQLVNREKTQRRKKVRLTDFHEQLQQGHVEELRLILKADVAGSVEVLSEQLADIQHDEARVEIIHAGVGHITENDVLLADASSAVIIGFNVRPDAGAQAAAVRDDIDIKVYNIIYQVVEDVRSALEGLLKPEEVVRTMSTVEVRKVFNISKTGTIAGCMVQSGTVKRSQRARLLRGGEEIFDGGLSSLKRFKDDVREVAQGFECGIGLDGFNALEEGDIIETYVIEEVARRLSGA